MKTNKIWTLIPALILTLTLFAGCSKNNGAVGTATVAPQASAPMTTPAQDENTTQSTDSAQGSDAAQGSNAPQEGGSAASTEPDTQPVKPMDWLKDFMSVESRINMLSEIDSSCVLVDDSVALVGVTFDSAYQGELTERIREMVAGEVQAADVAIQTVGVTADEADVAKIQELAEQVRSGNAPQDLTDQINSILNNTTTMK